VRQQKRDIGKGQKKESIAPNPLVYFLIFVLSSAVRGIRDITKQSVLSDLSGKSKFSEIAVMFVVQNDCRRQEACCAKGMWIKGDENTACAITAIFVIDSL